MVSRAAGWNRTFSGSGDCTATNLVMGGEETEVCTTILILFHPPCAAVLKNWVDGVGQQHLQRPGPQNSARHQYTTPRRTAQHKHSLFFPSRHCLLVSSVPSCFFTLCGCPWRWG